MPRVIHKPKNKQGGFGPQNLKDQIFGRQKRSGMAESLSASEKNQKIILGSLSREALRNGLFKGAGALAGVAGVAALSVLSMPVHAADQSSNGNAAYSGDLNLTANVSEPGLSVTLPNGNSATLNLAPPFDGYSSDSATVTVAVGSHSNYKLYLSGDTNLTDGSGNTIPTLSNCSSGCAMTDNTNFTNAWGYAVGADASNYYGLQTAASTLVNNGTGTTGTTLTTYQIKFGAKVDHTVTPGAYTGTVNFIAVANVDSQVYMQYMTGNECTTASTTVYDVRDGKPYTIQRLADGKCWMLDNLALDPTNSNTIVNEFNTNASATTISYLKNGAPTEVNSNHKYASAGIMANPNTAATYPYWGKSDTESSNNCVADDNGADNCTDNWTVPRINISKIPNTTNPDNPVAYQYPAWSPNSTSENHDASIPSYGSYNIGVYYNYCAASVGSYCYGAGNAPEADASATEDICPSGWRLPTGGGSGEFQNLYNAYDATAVGTVNGYRFRAALSTPLSGSVYNSSGEAVSVGLNGNWWSSTRSSGNLMYSLAMNATNVYPVFNHYRSDGLAVRCVLQ